MPISLVGSAAGTTSATIPTHKIGDLIVAFAFRDGSTTNPTIAGSNGWTTITNTTDGTTCSVSAAWKIADATDEATGTWTNASRLVVVVLRGQRDSGTPIGTFAPGAGTTNTVNYAARTLTASNITGSSWFVAFAGHRSVDTTISTAPTGMVLIRTDEDATAEACAFATADRAGTAYGPAIADWPSTNVSITGTASGWQTMVIEVLADGQEIEGRKYITTPNNSTGANAGVLTINGGYG